MAYKRLGDILLAAGFINEQELDAALASSKAAGKRLGEELLDDGTITERQLIDILKIQLGVDDIDLSKVAIPVTMAQQIPKNLAKKHNVVPVKVAGDTLTLAMVDPLDYTAIEEVKAATRKRIIPVIATREATSRAITTLYGNENVSKAIDEMQSKLGATDSAMREAAAKESEENLQAAPLRFLCLAQQGLRRRAPVRIGVVAHPSSVPPRARSGLPQRVESQIEF